MYIFYWIFISIELEFFYFFVLHFRSHHMYVIVVGQLFFFIACAYLLNSFAKNQFPTDYLF